MRAAGLVMALACVLGLSPGAVAQSVPSETEWPVERNAQLLRQREWKVGLFGFDGGAHDRLQLGSLWLPWALAGANLHLKALLVDHNGWHLAFDSSIIHLNLSRLSWYGEEDIKGRLTLLPLELRVDRQVGRHLLVGLGSSYSIAQSSPAFDPDDLEGSGAYDSWVLSGQLTWRARRRLWLVAEVDWVLYQTAGGVVNVESQLDDFTTAQGRAKATLNPIDPGRGGAASLSIVVRARRFGLRLGAGYGHWTTPRLRVVVPRAIPYGLFDVFGRFGGPTRQRRWSSGT